MAIYCGSEIEHLKPPKDEYYLPAIPSQEQTLIQIFKEQMKEEKYYNSLAKEQIKKELNYNNAFENVIRENTKKDFTDFVKYKDKVKEEQTLKLLEKQGIIKVNWNEYYGEIVEEELSTKTKIGIALVAIGLCVVALLA